MENEYTITVEVTAPDGNSVFTLTTKGTREDLYLPEHATPGITPVLAYLAKVTR